MVTLTEEQQSACQLVDEGHNDLIIGQAGNGKRFIVNEVAKRLRLKGKKVSLTASTGVASQQLLNGAVLHSWAGLRDGRYSNGDLVRRLRDDDDQTIACRIRATDVLVVDEISMISEKVFEQLECICRHLRNTETYFGGLQIICVGDFYQLPPVTNDLYHDPGRHAFHSWIWMEAITHQVELTTVVRQSDHTLVTAINELERGIPSVETHKLMYKLSRPLQPPVQGEEKAIYLYSNNLDVDCHNASELANMPGEAFIYKSEDSGEERRLGKILAKRVLQLKLNCPVILLTNLTSSLVNGSTGQVIKLEADGPTVKFGNKTLKMKKKQPFTIYDPEKCIAVAERHQFPLKLSFAMTIHKSQELTIPRVIVSCSNIYQPGQLWVAVGRCVSTEGLQVLHYNPSSCKKHKAEVVTYCRTPGLPAVPNHSCCKKVYRTSIEPEEPHFVTEFSEDSEFEDSDLAAIEDFDRNTGVELEAETVAATVDEAIAPGQQPLGQKFNTEDIQELLEKLHMADPITSAQKDMNNSLAFLRSGSCQSAVTFMNTNYDHVLKLKKTTDGDKGTSKSEKALKDWTQFYKKFHAHLQSMEYRESCASLFSPRPVNALVAGTLIMEVRKQIVNREEKDYVEGPQQKEISVYAQGKIRYVGGRTVAKIK